MRAPSNARTTTEGGADEAVLRTTGRALVVGRAQKRVPPGEACGRGSQADTGVGLHVPIGGRTRGPLPSTVRDGMDRGRPATCVGRLFITMIYRRAHRMADT